MVNHYLVCIPSISGKFPMPASLLLKANPFSSVFISVLTRLSHGLGKTHPAAFGVSSGPLGPFGPLPPFGPGSAARGSDVSTSKKRFESGSDAKSARPSRRVVAED